MVALMLALVLAPQQADTLTLRQALDLARTGWRQVELPGSLTAEGRAGVGIAGTIPRW